MIYKLLGIGGDDFCDPLVKTTAVIELFDIIELSGDEDLLEKLMRVRGEISRIID
jgi:hypothetical protein